jgi:hypothetical protein
VGKNVHDHPYAEELKNLTFQSHQFEFGKEILYAPMSEKKHIWVDEPGQVRGLLEVRS